MVFWRVILLFAIVWAEKIPEGTNTNNTRARSRFHRYIREITSSSSEFSNKGRIIGGDVSPPNKYPWIASVVKDSSWSHICGASIITQRVALTAAHCTKDNEPLTLRLGTSDISKAGVLIPVAGYSTHNWMPEVQLGDDIALLHLARPITFGKTIRPICLPNKKPIRAGDYVTIMGWGRTGEDLPPSNVLRETKLKIIASNTCKSHHIDLSPQSQICAVSDKSGACYGDSGGPLVYVDEESDIYILVGIVSYGSPNCDIHTPIVSTDVIPHINWIRSFTHNGGCFKGRREFLSILPKPVANVGR